MGAPSDQFLHLLWRPPNYVFFFLYYMGAPRIISLHTILGPTDHFLRLLYGAPQISFFSFNMGAPLRSVLLFTIVRSVSLHAIGGPPHILVFSQNISDQIRSNQISFSAYYMGPSQVSFFVYYMGSPQISFFAYFNEYIL